MSDDLEAIFGVLADQLPEDENAEFLLSAENLPQAPAVMQTDRLVLQAGRHGYNGYTIFEVDSISVQAHKRTYRQLGLCLLSKVFHQDPARVTIQLTHPASTVKALVLDYDQRESWSSIRGYLRRPASFTYTPSPVELYFDRLSYQAPGLIDELPLFTLSDAKHIQSASDPVPTPRDTVFGAGSDEGCVLFAQLLLDVGRAAEAATHVNLENRHGYGGVGFGSAEICLFLPGDIGWLADLL
jgi:hypothetical protein